MNHFERELRGGDLRSIGKSNTVVELVRTQDDFNELFQLLFHFDPIVVMRAADAIEKITLSFPHFLVPHKQQVLHLAQHAANKELKWHLALLLGRLPLGKKEAGEAWKILSTWAKDKMESRIVRVNAIQGLCNLLEQHEHYRKDILTLLREVEEEHIPSINARIRKLRGKSN